MHLCMENAIKMHHRSYLWVLEACTSSFLYCCAAATAVVVLLFQYAFCRSTFLINEESDVICVADKPVLNCSFYCAEVAAANIFITIFFSEKIHFPLQFSFIQFFKMEIKEVFYDLICIILTYIFSIACFISERMQKKVYKIRNVWFRCCSWWF